jgi:hypothetical protein
VHINTLLLQQVLAEPAWAKKLSDEGRRGLTALFWSNINPYLDEFPRAGPVRSHTWLVPVLALFLDVDSQGGPVFGPSRQIIRGERPPRTQSFVR